MKDKPSLLIPIQWYVPGFRAGGLIQAIKRLANGLSKNYEVYILTTNLDLGATASYDNIQTDCWLTIAPGLNVQYFSKANTNRKQVRKEITLLQPDFIYLKSMFNPLFSIYPLWLKYRGIIKSQIVIAPSGMLKESALAYSYWKKKVFLSLFINSGLSQKINWHATDLQEQGDIHKQIGSTAKVWLLPEFSPSIIISLKRIEKRDSLKLLYISRIHPVKNLSFILDCLKKVTGEVTFNIYGPIEKKSYWSKCQELITQLPSNISATYKGELPHNEVSKTIQQHHVFILPSQGEGFGNVILEALCSGRPIIISDQTPWENLEAAGAGYDYSLEEPSSFISALERFVNLDQTSFEAYCENALNYANQATDNQKLIRSYSELFGIK
jgi:glycosyltransferase involved in cell wall biosynthesis